MMSSYLVPGMCGLALLVGSIIALSPIGASGSAYAEDQKIEYGDNPKITLTIKDDNEKSYTEVQPGIVNYRYNNFNVKLTSDSWYAVLIRAANGYSSDLVHYDSSNKATNAKVSGVGQNVAPANFRENTWGYALTTDASAAGGDLVYNTLPASDELVPAYAGTGDDASGENGKNFKVAFAARLGNDAPDGHYRTNVYISVVTNPSQVAGAFDASTMQELGNQPALCKNAVENTTSQLIDERDGKKYWVTKLKDGNCWMTQNLDFDIPGTLSSSASDVAGTVTTGTTNVDDFTKWTNTDPTFNGYYDPGALYYIHKGGARYESTGSGCGVGASSANLTDNGITHVKAEGKTDMESFLDSCKEFSRTGTDTHYHVGNYYSWSAATVKSGDSLGTDSSKTASMSICPRGWQLPTAGEKFGPDTNGSFAHLLKQYNLASAWNAGTINGTSAINGVTYHVYSEPLYFVFGGAVYNQGLGYAGGNGLYWSSTPSTTTGLTYHLDFTTGLNPSNSNRRSVGYSVRCLLLVD